MTLSPLDERAFLAVCISDTPENTRSAVTIPCVTSILDTVDLQKHTLVLIDNGSTDPTTQQFMATTTRASPCIDLATLGRNRYATAAFNTILKRHRPHFGQHLFIRIENDIVFETSGWVEVMQETFAQADRSRVLLGLLSTLPVDLDKGWDADYTLRDGRVLFHKAKEVPGYTTAFHPDLLKRLGYLQSAGLYIEDIITSDRAVAAGFTLGYVPRDRLVCRHIDTQEARPAYQQWKREIAAKEWPVFESLRRKYRTPGADVYVPFGY